MLEVISTPIANIKPNPKNARTHSKKQIRQIADSIRQFGFVNPILADETGVVIAGHGRLLAALMLESHEVPVIT
jgi:ParB-like chromosome segregation protein Spo0J